VLTIFGFVVKRKGFDLAIAAMRHLPDDVALLIAGGAHPDDQTGFVDEVQDRIDSEGLSKRMVITGYLPDTSIPIAMAATDITIAPFTAISNSGSILTSMAYGKPIITADLPWSQEINARKQRLLLFRAGDSEDLAAKIKNVLDDHTLRLTLIRAVKSYAKTWTVAQSASKTVAAYKELMDECV
jgi:glycosyltransferase involved in cell wall biosynthesis